MNRERGYRADIDGLRALAVIVVLVYHAFPSALRGGFVGVDVFFVISGYLISGIILAAAAEGRFSFAGFYARRIRRIFPALALVFAGVLTAGWYLLYADDYRRLGRHVAAGAAFVSNIVLWQESSYFDVAADLKPLLHLWSLGIEEQFYLAWPLMLAAAVRWRRGPLALTLIVGIASFLIAIWTVRIDRTAAFYAPWTRFWELLAGATLACVEADRQLDAWWKGVVSRPSVRDAFSLTAVAAIAAGVALIHPDRVFPGLWVLLPVGGTFLAIAAGRAAIVNRTVLAWPPVVWIGLISYPLYLWHWPLLSFAKIVGGGTPPPLVRAALLGISALLAWVTYVVIERPLRFGRSRRYAVAGLAAAMSVLLAGGLFVDRREGLLDRAVNRSDAAHLIDYYDRMRRSGLRDAYRHECDFMDWDTGRVRDAVSPECVARGSRYTVMLWGDSFAQALSLGLRESLPDGASLAQVTTSMCPPQIEDFATAAGENRCERADRYAMEVIAGLKPEMVILAQDIGHEATDWAKLTHKVLELGAKQVIVVGPSPTFDPALPRIYAEHHMEDLAEYVSRGLNAAQFDVDRRLAARVVSWPNVRYVSLMNHLCRDGACLARVPGEDPLDLMIVDYGHLSPKGSAFVGRTLFAPLWTALP